MVQELTDLETKILKQLEYYFGDVNLPKDRFLNDLVNKENGWIPIKTLLTFNRLKAMTTKQEDIISSIKKSNSQLIELSTNNEKIRRIKPLPEINEQFVKNIRLRTVHLKGFPLDTTLEEIFEFCSNYGEVESVLMRRFQDKKFKGCVFTIFKTVEAAEKAISSTDKFKNENSLMRENKENYFIRKKKNKSARKENKLVKIEVNADNDENDEKKDKDTKFTFDSGCVIKLFGLPKDITFKEIKPYFLEHSKVQYVDIFPETQSAIVRFSSKEQLELSVEKLSFKECNDENVISENINDDNEVENETLDDENNQNKNKSLKKLKLGENIISYKILEGEEENNYWKAFESLKIKPKNTKNNKNFKKASYQNRSKKNKRKRSASDSEKNQAKQIKV